MVVYTIKEKGNLTVKASSPLYALRKFVNKIIINIRRRHGDIFQLRDQFVTFTDPDGRDNVYMFNVEPSNVQRSIYYERDYEIQVFKLMRTL